jgi:hypothetical protein
MFVSICGIWVEKSFSQGLKTPKNMENQLKNESFAYSDETSWPVNGELWYLWLFVTNIVNSFDWTTKNRIVYKKS